MPHAAFYVVEPHVVVVRNEVERFNAARGFLCGGTIWHPLLILFFYVSMPHAAFYVVEPTMHLWLAS